MWTHRAHQAWQEIQRFRAIQGDPKNCKWSAQDAHSGMLWGGSRVEMGLSKAQGDAAACVLRSYVISSSQEARLACLVVPRARSALGLCASVTLKGACCRIQCNALLCDS